MTNFRLVPLIAALAAISALMACTTPPAMPMGSASSSGMHTPEHMAKMDAQMKTMRDMHARMMAAKTPEERSKMMGEHMKAMQGGMDMMGSMPGAGMGDMKAMPGMQAMPADMAAHHQMMAKRMEMMQSMMEMMMDRMPSGSMK